MESKSTFSPLDLSSAFLKSSRLDLNEPVWDESPTSCNSPVPWRPNVFHPPDSAPFTINDDELESPANYRILDQIGVGGYGSVHRALNLANQRFYAIKVVVLNEKRLRKIFMEPQLHARMCHRNVAMLKGAFSTETHLNIVQTFYGGGNLRDKIKQAHNCRVDPAEAVKYITQIAMGLDHIHRMGVIHRDIKESNIFLSSAGVPKIGDFGIAKEDDPSGINTGYGGTRGWMSPEMIQSTPYTYTTDIWSLGVVCYRLITGKKPFVENDGTTLSERIIVAEYPPSRFLDGAAGDLVEGFLKVDPSLRIRLSDVCEQPWIQQHVWIRSRHKRHRPALNLKSMN
ncbi:hypothetical protein CJJ07_002437 [Candidozyma auris]|nr:hypothetical protein CJJ07_002437 [[Candida] auris]QEL63087.1 hypothetical protein CJJ09_005281 [[Candida] auris]